jgi:hypothetical protein
MFPVTDAEAPPTANPRGFANLLWKQLDHLGCVANPNQRSQRCFFLIWCPRSDSNSRFSRPPFRLIYFPRALGCRNAGFDPALFRVDAYGNVLYLHADSASPLAWDIDHWFPCASKNHDLMRFFFCLILVSLTLTLLMI